METERFALIRALPETGRKYRFSGRGPDGHGLPWTDAEVKVRIIEAPPLGGSTPEEVSARKSARETWVAEWTHPKTGTSFWHMNEEGRLVPRYSEPSHVTVEQLEEIQRDRRISVRVLDGSGGDRQDEQDAKAQAAELEKRLEAANKELAAAAERLKSQDSEKELIATKQGDRIKELEAQLAQAMAAVGDKARRQRP